MANQNKPENPIVYPGMIFYRGKKQYQIIALGSEGVGIVDLGNHVFSNWTVQRYCRLSDLVDPRKLAEYTPLEDHNNQVAAKYA